MKKNIVLITTALSFSFMLMLILNRYTPMYFDDFRYAFSWNDGKKMTFLAQIIPSMIAHYKTMNGRIILHALDQMFYLLGGTSFDILNSVAFSAFVLVIYFHVSGSFKNFSVKLYFLYFILIWFVTPAFGESFLWMTGSANYLFGPLIGLCFLIPYRCNYKKPRKKNGMFVSVVFALIYFVFGLIAGWTNENLSLCLAFIQIVFFVSFLLQKRKLSPWMISGLLGNIAGGLLMLLSPSYYQRSGIWSGKSSVLNMIHSFILNMNTFLTSFILLIVLISFSFVIYINRGVDRKKLFEDVGISALFLLGTLAYLASVMVCDYFPTRAWTACVAFQIIAFGNIFTKIDFHINKKVAINVAFAVCVLVFLFGSYYSSLLNLKGVDYAFKEREKTISECIKNGEKYIALAPITSASKYSCYRLCKVNMKEKAAKISQMLHATNGNSRFRLFESLRPAT